MYMDIGNKRRARGDRDVFFDSKRNLYVGMLSYIDPKTGKRYRPTVYDKSEKQARLKLKALEREHNDSVNSKLDNRITVSGWLEAWFRDFQSGKLRIKSSERQELCIQRHINPYIGDIKLLKLTTEDIQRLYRTLSISGKRAGGGLSAQSIRHVHNTLSNALRKAEEVGRIKRNPITGTEPPSLRSKKSTVNFMTEEHTKVFLETAKSMNNRHYTAFLTGFSTGLRRGELLGLLWSDINLDKGCATIRQSLVTSNRLGPIFEVPKTEGSNRTIPLSKDVCEELRKLKVLQNKEELAAWKKAEKDAAILGTVADGSAYYTNSGLVFRQENGQRVDPRSFSRSFKNILKHANISSSFRVHDMRHTFASTMIRRGVDIKRIQAILGHASPEITLATYSHLMEGDLNSAVGKLDGVYTIS